MNGPEIVGQLSCLTKIHCGKLHSLFGCALAFIRRVKLPKKKLKENLSLIVKRNLFNIYNDEFQFQCAQEVNL